MIIAAACTLGFLLAWAAGADPRRLATVRLRWGGLVFAALALQLAIFAFGVRLPGLLSSERVTHVASYILLLAFALRNARLAGFAVAALGLVSNAAVIFVNGGRMPVDGKAWAESGGQPAQAVYNNVALVHDGTHLRFLGDMFALPGSLPLANTFSIGDVLLLGGVALFVYNAGRRERDRPRSRSLEPLRNRDFRALLAGRTVSKLGDWISIGALVTWIYARTHSTAAVSGLLLARLLAAIVGGLVGGGILDRFPRFQVLRAVEAARALATATAIGCVAAGLSLPVAMCVFVSSFLAAATDPTASSLVADILPTDSRHAGNALHAVSRATVMAAGALAGGLAATGIGAVPALIADTFTFVLAVALYSRSLPDSAPRAVADAAAAAREPRRLEALAFIARRPTLLALVGAFTLATFAMGLLNASLPEFLTGHAPGVGGYGVAIGTIGFGLMFGEFLSGRLGHRIVARAPALGFALSAGALFAAADSHLSTTVLLLLFLLGLSDGTTETAYDTLVQRETPQRLSARVFALAASVQQCGMVAGFLLAPLIENSASAAPLHASSAVLAAAAFLAIAVFVHPGVLRRRPLFATEAAVERTP